jgi:HEAT repeat protein
MEEISKINVYEIFASVSAASLTEFRQSYQALYEEAPLRAVKLFLYYLSVRGPDTLAEVMAEFATKGRLHISVLLDANVLNEDSITPAVAYHSIRYLPDLDPRFLYKFATTTAALQDATAILRALRVAPALPDYSILISWMRNLASHSDKRVRSRAAKLMCQLRPSNGQIKRNMESRDDRVRASAIEALWNPRMTRKDQEVRQILQNALNDSNHRVVANALVGLYMMGDAEALQKMVDLCQTRNHLFRAAMAWAMGIVDDLRAVPALQFLTLDPSFTVRNRAANSLKAIGQAPLEDTEFVPPEAKAQPAKPAAPALEEPVEAPQAMLPRQMAH